MVSALYEEYKQFLTDHYYLTFVALIVYLASVIALFCFRGLSQSVPINYILMTLLTIAMSYLV